MTFETSRLLHPPPRREVFEMPVVSPPYSDSISTPEEAWYALKVKPKHEKVVARSLRAKGYAELLPLYDDRHKSGNGFRLTKLPLFPGYVFCRFDIRRRLPVLKVPGVSYIVGEGKLPTPIDAAEIESLQLVANSRATVNPCEYLAAGTPVRIENGPLAGVRGILQSYKNECRVVISVSLLLRSVAVELDRQHIVEDSKVTMAMDPGRPTHSAETETR